MSAVPLLEKSDMVVLFYGEILGIPSRVLGVEPASVKQSRHGSSVPKQLLISQWNASSASRQSESGDFGAG
jgi:hypothetical protein